MKQIQNFEIIPIGRGKNLENQIFGDYKVLYRTQVPEGSTSKQAHWLCQCIKCGEYFIKSAYQLQNHQNNCICRTSLIGKKFGRWTVLELTQERTKNRGKIWKCKCDCGIIKNVPGDILKRGESKSCGCLQKEIASQLCIKNRIDLTGQRFGKLIALKPIYSKTKNQHTKWLCQCDCGNQCEIDMGNLRQGFSQSCGCTQSKQEENIIKLLTSAGINFKYQYSFANLPNKKFDFFIEDTYVIEFDGSQHFNFTNSGWDTEEKYIKTHQSDLLKNKYCFDNNIPIIRIPYSENYNLNDLKLETSHFLLTRENEKKYYNKK